LSGELSVVSKTYLALTRSYDHFVLTVPFQDGPDIPVINDTGMPDALLSEGMREIAGALEAWVRSNRRSAGTLANRGRYDPPDEIYAQMIAARTAAETDDVVAASLELTQSLALQGTEWESPEPDEADIFNQISGQLDLDRMLRTMWRETAIYGQTTIATWWGNKTYRVRGFSVPEVDDPEQIDPLTRGRRRRKEFDVYAPVAWTVLDPLRVVPVGTGIFGTDPICWSADESEMSMIDDISEDPLMNRLFLGRYQPGLVEQEWLSQYGVGDMTRLMLLDPEFTFRFTVVKPDYIRFAPIPLASVFALLDLKRQLIEADRAALVGAANYILVVKVGSKEAPGKQSEVDAMEEQLKTSVKLPVIVADQRLEVEIVAPPRDMTLIDEKYETLDSRIAARMLSVPQQKTTGSEAGTSMRASALGRVLESQRLMLRRIVERQFAKAVVDHPKNEGVFTTEPNLAFIPRRVQVSTDQSELAAVMTMRSRNEISRDTTLEYLGFDQDVEARRRVQEKLSGYDQLFQTAVPFNSPQNPTPGQNPTSPTGKGRPPTATAKPKTQSRTGTNE
jgi:hypothetical protein